MILFVFVIIGVLVGLMINWRRGVKNSLDAVNRIHGLLLPIAGVLLEGSFTYLPKLTVHYAGIITCTSYLCIFAFLYLNRTNRAAAGLMALGSLSNFSVIAANSFRMPVSPAVLSMYPGLTAEAVYAKKVNYFIALHGAKLYGLGDIIPVPLRFAGGFVSVGDLILGVGLVWFLIWLFTFKEPENGAKQNTPV